MTCIWTEPLHHDPSAFPITVVIELAQLAPYCGLQQAQMRATIIYALITLKVGSELPSNNYGKSPLIISCKNTSAQRVIEASLLRDGRVNLPLCNGILDQPTHMSDVTQHSQASFVLPNSSAPPASALLTIELTKPA